MTKKYDFRDYPEHEARLSEWRDRWIANALSTAAMTDADRAACVQAVYGMYAAAKLAPPKHVVFVPSPFVLAFAGGFSAVIWHRQAAIRAAIRDAIRDADLGQWYVLPCDMRRLAYEIGIGYFGLRCAAEAFKMWQYGNQDSGYDAYLSFFQDVAGLPLDYAAYAHWRTLAERSGPRIMHPDFCMISDRPELLTIDAENRPHGEGAPFCRWRDGTALYAWHGQRIPAAWMEGAPPSAAEALRWPNMDQRAAACEIVGWHNILDQLKARTIDDSGDPLWGRLVEVSLPDSGRERFLDAMCGTGRRFALPVPPSTSTVDAAQSALHGGVPAAILRHSVTRT